MQYNVKIKVKCTKNTTCLRQNLPTFESNEATHKYSYAANIWIFTFCLFYRELFCTDRHRPNTVFRGDRGK